VAAEKLGRQRARLTKECPTNQDDETIK